VIVFPETIGTWLVAANEPGIAYKCPSVTLAMILFIFSHLLAFIIELINAISQTKLMQKYGIMGCVQRTIFRIKAKKSFDIYTQTFSEIAKENNAYVVAGSTFLPRIIPGKGRYGVSLTNEGLYNVALTFAPDGSVCNIAYKNYLIPEEREFLDASTEETLSTFDTSFGRIAVVICADSWVPSMYKRIQEQKVDIICVPILVDNNGWDSLWEGYNLGFTPSDVDTKDIGTETNKSMWNKYSVNGRVHSTTARVAIRSCIHGKIWDMGLAGQSSIKIVNNNKDDVLIESSHSLDYQDVIIKLWNS